MLMYTGKFAFIMTKDDGDRVLFQKAWGDRTRKVFFEEMICAFNREGFLNPNNFLSKPVPGDGTDYIFGGLPFQVDLEDCSYSVPSQFSHNFNAHQIFDEDTPEAQLFFNYADLTWYVSEIFHGRITHSRIIKDALGFYS